MAALSLSRRLFSNFTGSFSSILFPKNDPLSIKVKQVLFDYHDLLSKPDVLQFVGRVNRAMKQVMKYPFQDLPYPVQGRSFFQHVDIFRNDDKFNYAIIKLVMPGVGEDGFKMWLDEDNKKVVHITGEEEREKGRKYEFEVQIESLVLPYFPYFDQMKTYMENGILYIVLPLNKKLWI